MAPRTVNRPARTRNRKKRKRRDISSSSSETSSSSFTSESENEKERGPTTVRLPQKRPLPTKAVAPGVSTTALAESSSGSSESETASSSEPESEMDYERETGALPRNEIAENAQNATSPGAGENFARPNFQSDEPYAPSPPPVRNVPAPNILDGDREKEEALRTRFRQFWLGCVADAFSDDLNEIRKEPNLTPARLNLLIDSLAAGANVYSSSGGRSHSDGDRVNEMEVVLGLDE